jgi:hypothetical protein
LNLVKFLGETFPVLITLVVFRPAISCPGPAIFRPLKHQKYQNENDNNLSIWTPFSMILGSLESQQQFQQIYAEKHHSSTKQDKIK